MAKDYIMMIIDTSPGMFENYDNTKKNIDAAIECIEGIIKHNLFYKKKNNQMAVYLCGNYENNFIVPFQKNSIDLLRYIRSISKILEAKSNTVKLMKNIKSCLKHVESKKGRSKGDVKLYVFTAGDYESGTPKNIGWIMNYINFEKNTYLYIISLQFWEDNDIISKKIIENKTHITQLTTVQNINIFSSSLIFLINHSLKNKHIIAKCNYKGYLEICPTIKLEIIIYSKITKEKLPSFKYYDNTLKFDKSITKHIVKSITNYYYDTENFNKKYVNNNNIIRGYKYGEDIIPIKKETDILIKENKCLKIIGFVKEDEVPRYSYMSPSQVIYASGSNDNRLAFNSIIKALLKKSKLGIARYINKDERAPKLVILHPYYKSKVFCFYLLELPTVEEIREYEFQPLPSCTNTHRNIIKQIIDQKSNNKNKSLKLLNPQLLYYNQCIEHKINENLFEYPEINQAFLKQFNIGNEIEAKLENDILKNFDLVYSEKYLNIYQEKKYWKELLFEQAIKTEKLYEEIIESKLIHGDDINDVRDIGETDPISDFKHMVTNDKIDLVEKAIKGMESTIHKYILNQEYDNAYECLKVLRDTCILEDEYVSFNNILKSIKSYIKDNNYNLFFDLLTEKKFTLISNEEHRDCDVTKDYAIYFINNKCNDVDNSSELFEEIE